MTCSEFEDALAGLLASPGAPVDAAAVARLRAHAAACDACSGSRELLELGLMPAGRRDPIEDPGARYWAAFEARLAVRLKQERGRGRRRIALASVGAAAAAAAVAAAVIVLRGPTPDPGPSPAPSAATVQVPYLQETPVAAVGGADSSDVDDDAELEFAGTEPLDAFAEDDAGVLFPAVEGLAPAEEKRLLEWLADEETKAKRGAA